MATSVLGGLSKDQTVSAAAAPTGVYEVDNFSVGAATAGTVTLSFVWNGVTYTTTAIPFNASAQTSQGIIQAATGPQGQVLPGNSVTVTGALSSGATIIFSGAMVGPITGQTITPAGLTGGTPAFTQTVPGINPILPIELRVRGSDGKMYKVAGVGAGDGSTQLEVYVGGSPTQGFINNNSSAPTSGFLVGFKDANGHLSSPNLDAAGALTVQSAGTPGSPVPAKTMAVGGTDGTNLRTLSVNSAGAALTQAMASAGGTAPGVFDVIGGLDNTSLARAVNVSAGGALSINDASSIPESPLSLNGTAWSPSTATAPPSPYTVTTSSTLLLPDSTGGSAINGPRAQIEIINGGNVDVWVSPSLTAAIGCLWVIRPGGSLIESYSGPVSIITNNTASGATVTSPVAQVAYAEW